jgi:hypothetical protein
VVVTVHPHATRPLSHLTGCVGFWLWALVGAGLVLGLISLGVLLLVPAIVLAVVLARRWRGGDDRIMVGLVAGAGLPLLVVAAVQWNSWHHRIAGDNTPNPFYWGGVGLCLLAAGIVAYAVRSRRNS